ncbi:Uncharacterised protein [Mycobacteroides abscessus]|nr:Uncharacterised protein [Mycobacteroides abscessus]
MAWGSSGRPGRGVWSLTLSSWAPVQAFACDTTVAVRHVITRHTLSTD